MARIVLTCMDALMPRTQDAEERPYNPFAFPPSMAVRWRRYDCRDAGVRATQGAVAENRVGNSGRGAADII